MKLFLCIALATLIGCSGNTKEISDLGVDSFIPMQSEDELLEESRRINEELDATIENADKQMTRIEAIIERNIGADATTAGDK